MESKKRNGIVFVLANGCQARFLGGCVIQNKMELCWTTSAVSPGAFFVPSWLANGLLVQGTGILPECKSSFKSQCSASSLFLPNAFVRVLRALCMCAVDSRANHYVKRHGNRKHTSKGLFLLLLFLHSSLVNSAQRSYLCVLLRTIERLSD